ncbi:hypothetical protein [Lachnobacterium bovis]|uniref:Cyclic lactone autoinducer peptide n=1 Tax=Lachnobacterium bovis DSM 14045 TaxID=1122142 RepID=A0A1H3GBF5_9FIRM|nr:hypothetical protein [Lachnobacterium bovis]MBQ1802864.1 hypothetical protein [Lachnobacterium sp.]SDY00601.1 hypothetical protein SAMN02910414_00514 [Lachnobacterium bovis DSM 14045]
MKNITPKKKKLIINSVKALVSITLLLVIATHAPNLTNTHNDSYAQKANSSYCQNK